VCQDARQAFKLNSKDSIKSLLEKQLNHLSQPIAIHFGQKNDQARQFYPKHTKSFSQINFWWIFLKKTCLEWKINLKECYFRTSKYLKVTNNNHLNISLLAVFL